MKWNANTGSTVLNTITVARDLGAQIQAKLTTPGRVVLTPSKGDWITVNGKDYSCYVEFAGGDLERRTFVFKTRKEQCDWMRAILNRPTEPTEPTLETQPCATADSKNPSQQPCSSSPSADSQCSPCGHSSASQAVSSTQSDQGVFHVKQSNKPTVAEVILAELMSAQAPLPFDWLARRCLKEAGDYGNETAADTVFLLKRAGLVEMADTGRESFWSMTDEGRALILQRPPYNCYRAIRDELAACGPLMASELEHACRRQASDYCADVFMRTLYDMLQSGLVVDCTERGDAHSTYDLPEASE
jgi:hypothetical protein